jgi:LPS sulfotransferase NodH
VRQAISWLKFVQGTAWYWEEEEPQRLDGLEYRPEVIGDFIVQTAVHETAWLEFFRKTDIQPYTVVYEDFVDAYEETAKGILDHLGIPYPTKLLFGPRRMKRQADALTDKWVRMYLESNKDLEEM